MISTVLTNSSLSLLLGYVYVYTLDHVLMCIASIAFDVSSDLLVWTRLCQTSCFDWSDCSWEPHTLRVLGVSRVWVVAIIANSVLFSDLNSEHTSGCSLSRALTWYRWICLKRLP